MSYGAPGRGRHITIYANAGHAFMVVDGRRYDTSAIGETGSRWTSTHRSGRATWPATPGALSPHTLALPLLAGRRRRGNLRGHITPIRGGYDIRMR